MSIASRHGKLHIVGDVDGVRHRRIEDLLTADVFGAYRYLPAEFGILPLLAGATSSDGITLQAWARERDIPWSDIEAARIHFWPAFGDKEPDLLVELNTPSECPLLVLVEAKLHSDQHEIDGRSQIGYYGGQLLDDDLMSEVVEGELPTYRAVVFLTASPEPPLSALLRARGELEAGGADGRTEIFWASWHGAREVAAVILEAERTTAPPHIVALLEDLLEDLAERGFSPPRARVPWPMPALPELPAQPVHAWLATSLAPTRPPLSMALLVGTHLDDIGAVLRDWRPR